MVRNTEFRQGDVFLVRIPTKTESIQLKNSVHPSKNRIILAHGEATGHAHALPASDVELYEIESSSLSGIDLVQAHAANTRLLRVLRTTDLVHEEHGPIRLEPGDYLVSLQISFDEDDEWQKVQD